MLRRSRGTTISSNCFQICVALSFLFFMMLVLDSEKAFGWPTCPDRSGSLRVCLVHLRPIPPLLRDERWGWFSQAWFFRRRSGRTPAGTLERPVRSNVELSEGCKPERSEAGHPQKEKGKSREPQLALQIAYRIG